MVAGPAMFDVRGGPRMRALETETRRDLQARLDFQNTERSNALAQLGRENAHSTIRGSCRALMDCITSRSRRKHRFDSRRARHIGANWERQNPPFLCLKRRSALFYLTE